VGARQRGQAIVEFGIVALLFTLLMFAVVDFGLLLNSWVRLSSATREAARAASVGYYALPMSGHGDLYDLVNTVNLPGVDRSTYAPFVNYCCGAGGSNDKVVLSVAYYNGDPTQLPAPCIPGAPSCNPLPASSVDNHYWGGSCSAPCQHPARGDMLLVTLSAPGMEVITPLVRPFFGCSGNQAHCNVVLGSTAITRYEGAQ
jgi:hypothetical protein